MTNNHNQIWGINVQKVKFGFLILLIICNLDVLSFEFRGSRWSLPLDIDFDLFYTFDLKPFAPKSVKNGKGRLKGYKLTKRTNKKSLKKLILITKLDKMNSS